MGKDRFEGSGPDQILLYALNARTKKERVSKHIFGIEIHHIGGIGVM